MVGIDMHCLSLVDRPTPSSGKKPESRRRRLFLIARIWNAYRKEGGSVPSPSSWSEGDIPFGACHKVLCLYIALHKPCAVSQQQRDVGGTSDSMRSGSGYGCRLLPRMICYLANVSISPFGRRTDRLRPSVRRPRALQPFFMSLSLQVSSLHFVISPSFLSYFRIPMPTSTI